RVAVGVDVACRDPIRDPVAEEGPDDDLRVPGVGGDAAERSPQRVQVPPRAIDPSILVELAAHLVNANEGSTGVLTGADVVFGRGRGGLGCRQQVDGSTAERHDTRSRLSTPEPDHAGFKVDVAPAKARRLSAPDFLHVPGYLRPAHP